MTRKILSLASLLIICSLAEGWALAQTTTPSGSFSYALDVGGTSQLFTICSGLGATHKFTNTVLKLDNGNTQNVTDVELQPLIITLKRPVGPDLLLWRWFDQVEMNPKIPPKRNGSIQMFNQSTKALIARWEISNAWPVGLTIDEEGNEAIILVVESITRTR